MEIEKCQELCPPDAKKQKLDISEQSNSNQINNQTNVDDSKTGGSNSIGKIDSAIIDTTKQSADIETDSKLGGTQREVDVGITEYISSLTGFSGVIKQRYSDFLVNEVSVDGRLVCFTNTDIPCPVPDSPQLGETLPLDSAVAQLISEEDTEKLTELLQSKDQTKTVILQVANDKALRTKIHSAVAKGFPGLETTTVEKDGKKLIQVRITSNKGSGLRNWPKGRGDYCRFVLYKENKDTMDTVGLLAGKLRVKSGVFQYAGTKDRRAKTSQEVTAYRVAAEKLKDINQKLRNIVTGNYSYVSKPLRLSMLQGNKFTVVLRSVTGTSEQIDAGMSSLRDVGFINYYGMQRFGTSSIPSHHIGRALLQGEWKEAVELILKPRYGEEKQISEARQFWWDTRNHRSALNKFPKFSYIERNILYGLCDRDKDYMGALNKVARNTRLLYVHAYQSYVWNTVVSHRIREHGLKPILGDLVIPSGTESCCGDGLEGQSDEQSSKSKPIVIDDHNIGDYSIYDIVLPLVGYDSVYPDNDLRSLYKDLLVKDGLDYEDMRRKQKDFSLSGDYRHVLLKPKDVSWQQHRYDDPNIPLALSDWDKLNNDNKQPSQNTDGSQLALELQLTLPPSCYATMALRELLKIDTSSSHQASLNIK